ncbi:hypothetical protein, partial [Actinomycetospora atypica]
AHTAAVLGLMAFAVLVAVWSLRHGWRSDAERYPRLCTLEPLDARRLLRRELRRGRPGPVELRPFARAWVVHQLRRTGNPPVLICLAAWYLALFDPTDNAPMLLLGLGLAMLALLALAAAQLVLQHRAAQVADALETAEGTGPHGQVSACERPGTHPQARGGAAAGWSAVPRRARRWRVTGAGGGGAGRGG